MQLTELANKGGKISVRRWCLCLSDTYLEFDRGRLFIITPYLLVGARKIMGNDTLVNANGLWVSVLLSLNKLLQAGSTLRLPREG